MRIVLALLALVIALTAAQAQTPAPPRGLFDRVLHPFGGSSKVKTPHYSDPRLRGLLLQVSVPETIKLSEVRQLPVSARLGNYGIEPVMLDFPTAQRIDIQLLDPAGHVLTKWSENRAFAEQGGTALINPHEGTEWHEGIATRELQPGRVYTLEVYLPRYPELRARQKFMTAP